MASLSIPPPLPIPDVTTPPPAPAPSPAPASGPQNCANCRKSGASLRCGICRKKSYCDRDCQKQDWPFHKRICEKPKEIVPSPKPDAVKPKAEGGEPEAPAPTAKPSSSNEVELDEEDLAAIADVRKKGYAYHARKLADDELKAIGDIRPKAVSTPPATESGTPSSSGGGSSGDVTMSVASSGSSTAGSAGPVLLSTEAAVSLLSKASVWNANGSTVEERDLTQWARGRLKELLRERRDQLVVPLPGVGRLEATGITGWGSSTADILISRGKTRFIYDLHFGVVVELVTDAAVAAEGGGEGEGSSLSQPLLAAAGADVRDEDDEGGDDPKGKAATGGKGSGAGEGSSAASASSSSSSSSSSKRKKQPRAVVRFCDVSNDTEEGSGSGLEREVRIEWGKPAPKEDQRDMVTAALHNGGVVTSLRGVVEALVAEFKTK